MSSDERVFDLAKAIPLAVPQIEGNAWKYIKECIDSGWVSTAGSFVSRFEEDVANYVGVEHAVATNSGTAALHIALLVAGVEQGDEVLVPTLTFVAPVNAIQYTGARPVFMDAEPKHWQMDVDKLSDFLLRECHWSEGALRNKTSGRRIKAILPVHILGHPADMEPIIELARQYDITVVSDAAESLGAEYKGQRVGSQGDVTCFSFNGNKVVTAGGGGMVVTNNTEWADRARYLTTQAKDDPIEYVHNEVGFNYRLTNIQAALGVAQLEQLDEYIAKKRSLASLYRQGLDSVQGIAWPQTADWALPTFWLSTLLVDSARYGMDSRALLLRLEKANIQARPLWHPIYRLKPFRDCVCYRIEVADVLYRDALSLPSSVGLAEHELHQVVEVITRSAS